MISDSLLGVVLVNLLVSETVLMRYVHFTIKACVKAT